MTRPEIKELKKLKDWIKQRQEYFSDQQVWDNEKRENQRTLDYIDERMKEIEAKVPANGGNPFYNGRDVYVYD